MAITVQLRHCIIISFILVSGLALISNPRQVLTLGGHYWDVVVDTICLIIGSITNICELTTERPHYCCCCIDKFPNMIIHNAGPLLVYFECLFQPIELHFKLSLLQMPPIIFDLVLESFIMFIILLEVLYCVILCLFFIVFVLRHIRLPGFYVNLFFLSLSCTHF